MTDRYYSVGLMSGTSVDGIDAAVSEHVVDGDGGVGSRLVAAIGVPLADSARAAVFSLFEDGSGSLDALALLDMELGEAFAGAALAAIREAGMKPPDVAVIGSHGQTIRHVAGSPGSPRRASLQIGSGAMIAARTGIATVCDFRSGDIAVGGTGAPLVPFFDRIASARFDKPIAFQNYGGIGNVCWIPENGPLVAFDTGPANMIADRLVSEMTDGRLGYDRDGLIGSRGSLRRDLLARWLDHPFLAKAPPKSSGREEFGSAFYESSLRPLLGGVPEGQNREALYADLIRTAETFAAASAARAYRELLPALPRLVVVSGGGARNPVIMAELRAALPECEVRDADEVGLSVDYKEAMAFGLFGLLRLLGRPNTEPEATGAARAISAGALYLP